MGRPCRAPNSPAEFLEFFCCLSQDAAGPRGVGQFLTQIQAKNVQTSLPPPCLPVPGNGTMAWAPVFSSAYLPAAVSHTRRFDTRATEGAHRVVRRAIGGGHDGRNVRWVRQQGGGEDKKAGRLGGREMAIELADPRAVIIFHRLLSPSSIARFRVGGPVT